MKYHVSFKPKHDPNKSWIVIRHVEAETSGHALSLIKRMVSETGRQQEPMIYRTKPA